MLQNNLRSNKIKYETIALTSTLSSSILSLLSSDRENVIVPVSGDAGTIRQIMDELKKVRDSDSAFMTRLYGYPEWQTYSNLKDDYHLSAPISLHHSLLMIVIPVQRLSLMISEDGMTEN